MVARGVPAADVRDARESLSHPQLAHRNYFEKLDHPVVGLHPVSNFPFRFASVGRWHATAAPTLGQHNLEILRDLLGLERSDIERLEAAGVIGTIPAGLD